MTACALRAVPSASLSGRLHAPGDKSVSHRSMILGALAEGRTEIADLLESEDVLRTAAAVQAFGAKVEQHGTGRWSVTGRGSWRSPAADVDCGNAGTAVRLLLGAAGGFPLSARFTGDASLSRRPMGRVTGPLGRMGARFPEGDERLPLTLQGGGLRAIDGVAEVASAQVKSAVLLAGLNADGETRWREPHPTRDHTERMLRAFGAEVRIVEGAEGRTVALVGGQRLQSAKVRVPGDPSSAAFALVAGLTARSGDVTTQGVLANPLRTGLYETLLEMGAELEIIPEPDSGGEPVTTLRARSSSLRGVEVPAERVTSMIDEYPILAVAAAFAEGVTTFRGVAELRVKESDRLARAAAGLRACGVEVEEYDDGLAIRGCGGRPPGGARVQTAGDHRIAMSFLVLGLNARAPVEVDEAEMIATSYPGFVQQMRALGADLQEAA